MISAFHEKAWKEYLNWQKGDTKTIIRIHKLIKGVKRNNFDGIGKPEKLKYDLAGWYSLRIDKKTDLYIKFPNMKTIPLWKFYPAKTITMTNKNKKRADSPTERIRPYKELILWHKLP